jgi:hypothetical protein
MTIRRYFMNHPQFTPDGGTIRTIDGVDDALVYSGVPIDGTIFKMIKAGRYDDEIPEASVRRLRKLGGFCG